MAEGIPDSGIQVDPPASSLGDLRARVMSYVLAPDDPEAQYLADAGIKDSIRRINQHRWYWMRNIQQGTIGDGGTFYDLPAEFKSQISVEIVGLSGNASNTIRRLDYKNPSEFQRLIEGGQTDPYIYTIFNFRTDGVLVLGQAIDESLGLIIRYYANVIFPSGAGAYLEVPNEAEPFLEWNAKAYIAAHWSPGEKYSLARREADGLWMEMIRDNSRQETTDL